MQMIGSWRANCDKMGLFSEKCSVISVLGYALITFCTVTISSGTARAQETWPVGTRCSNVTVVSGKNQISCRDYSTIPDDIPDKEVNNLILSKGNTIQRLTSGQLTRSGLKSLNKLEMQNCQLISIEQGAFKDGGSLIDLDLSWNNIESLDPQVFSGLPSLRTLTLSNNPMHKVIPGTFFPEMPNLVKLDMSNCKLDTVPDETLYKIKKLDTLHLKNNQFKSLSWRFFRDIKLNTVTLDNNPWHCDCETRFLMDLLRERQIHQLGATCASSTNELIPKGEKWDTVYTKTPNNFVCKPNIDSFKYLTYDKSDSEKTLSDNVTPYPEGEEGAKAGEEVQFVCVYSGYPKPEIIWLKDNIRIDFGAHSGARSKRETSDDKPENDSSGVTVPPNPVVAKPRIYAETQTFNIVGRLNEKEQDYTFKDVLTIREATEADTGTYAFQIRNNGGTAYDKLVLNVAASEAGFIVGSGGNTGRVWIIILVAFICILILIVISLILMTVWRRREKQRQEGFRKVVHEKFKDSNVDIGEIIDMKSITPQQEKKAYNAEGSTPLLDSKSDASTVFVSTPDYPQRLPDLMYGNATLVRNSQIFSPKPPPAHNGYHVPDARKEFFARQISEPYLRPGSAMSLSRPTSVNVAQKRYIFANQQYPTDPTGGHEPQYAVPYNMQLPRSGSAMSMMPENDLRRLMFMRQYSQPSYATTARLPKRHTSTSSEPPENMILNNRSYNYSTLPRRPIKLQNWSRPASPTGSTCSSYSTLSWRPMGQGPLMSDGVGARQTADGSTGSTMSLNKTPDSIYSNGSDLMDSSYRNMTPTSAHMVKPKNMRTPRYGHNRTPSTLPRGSDFFSFEPIQEVETSDGASNLTLDKTNGRQTPVRNNSQSLARSEPRFKKKKPPPISVIPANLKEPSRSFDHLKGRQANSALKSKAANGNLKNASTNGNIADTSIQNAVNSSLNDQNKNGSILESPIDPEPAIKSFTKSPAPPPPPKPKRNPLSEDTNGVQTEGPTESTDDGRSSPVIVDGTVV